MKIKEGTTGLISYKADKYGKFITRPFYGTINVSLQLNMNMDGYIQKQLQMRKKTD